MGKPDSPLSVQVPGDSWREGRSTQSRSHGQPVWEQPEGRRPGPGRSQQSLRPRSTTSPRLQRVSWEGLQALGFGGSQLAELSPGMGWERVFHPGPVAHSTGSQKGRGPAGVGSSVMGWGRGESERKKGCYCQIAICIIDRVRSDCVFSKNQRTQNNKEKTSLPQYIGYLL